MKSGNVKLMKKMNVALIINQIRKHGPVSRTDITKMTDLSPTTVSTLVEELLKNKLIVEVGVGESKGGRKPILLDLNPTGKYMISIYISVDSLYVALLNLRFSIIDSLSVSLQSPAQKYLIYQIISSIDKLILKAKIDQKNIIGMGIGATGIIDKENGIITYSAALNLEKFPISEKLKLKYNFPIYLENDANLAALGEKEFGHANNFSNYLYIMIGAGIGSGIIIDNQIYHGKYGGAGEFGHIIIEKNGPQCECGNYGCLNSVLLPLIPIQSKEKLSSSFNLNTDNKLYESNNYKEFCQYLGIAISNYIKLFDPEAIIFGGEIAKVVSNRFYQDMRNTINRLILKGMNENLPVLPSIVEENPVILGGASLCFNKEFNSINI